MRAAASAVCVLIAVLLAGGAGRSAPSPRGPAPLERGWGRLLASGTLTRVDPARGTVTLAIAGSGRFDAFQGGTQWLQRPLAGAQLIHLLPATLVMDVGGHPVSLAAVHAKDPATLWAVVRPDAAILAVSLAILSPSPPAAPRMVSGDHDASTGVVLRRAGSTIEVLTQQGTRRSVVATSATAIWSSGAMTSLAILSPYDLVRVEGPVNSDGSQVATRIDVEFSAASAAQVVGAIEQSIVEIGGLIVDGTMVCTSAETYVIQDTTRAQFAKIPPGRPVAVYGTSITAGSMPVGLQARVVVVR